MARFVFHGPFNNQTLGLGRGFLLSGSREMAQPLVDQAERIAALPPVAYTGATLFGMPVSELTSWVMFVYALLLVAWHLKSKWLAKSPESEP